MTPDELHRRMRSLDLTGAGLARRLGRCQQQVSEWRTGKAPVPVYVGAYLDALDQIAELVRVKSA